MECFLRAAAYEDMELIYEWANDKEVRANSFQTRQITMEEHKAWYTNKLGSKSTVFCIMMERETPVGQIRLELDGEMAQVNYSIAKEFRGKGYGKKIVLLAEQKLRQEYPQIVKMRAEVKTENLSSGKVFERNGYVESFVTYEKTLM